MGFLSRSQWGLVLAHYDGSLRSAHLSREHTSRVGGKFWATPVMEMAESKSNIGQAALLKSRWGHFMNLVIAPDRVQNDPLEKCIHDCMETIL